MKIKITYGPGERLKARFVLVALQRVIPSAGVKHFGRRIVIETEE